MSSILGLEARSSGSATAQPDARSAAPAALYPADMQAFLERLRPIFRPRLQVIEAIAIGGMSTIVKLRHSLHGGLFVAKVLHPSLAGQLEVVASFRAEAVHMAQLAGHPGVVPIFDLAESDGLMYMLMPFIEGEDLDRLLQRNGPLPRREALILAAQIGSVLALAEANGITHCDVSPGNIRLDVHGHYRLLDFGISQSGTTGQGKASLGGTPLYASPEQASGRPPDIRSDIYSLGTILFEALTGRPLYAASTVEELATCRLAGAWEPTPELREDAFLLALLHRMLANDPAERFASAFELSGALSAYVEELPEFRPHSQRIVAEPRRRRLTRE